MASSSISGGSINFRGAGAARRSEAAHLPDAIPSSICSHAEQQILDDRKPDVDPVALPRPIVFVGTTAAGPLRRVRDAVLERQDARHPDPCRGRRRHAVQPLHPRGAWSTSVSRPWLRSRCWSAWSRRCCRRGGRPRRPSRGHRRSVRGSRRGLFAGGLLAEPVAAGAGLVVRAVWRRRLSVLRRRAREAEDEAAVRPVRLEGRLRAARRQSRARAARRTAARDDRALLGHPRLHDRHRARRSRKRSSAC